MILEVCTKDLKDVGINVVLLSYEGSEYTSMLRQIENKGFCKKEPWYCDSGF